ncbi:MAG: Crp/Fnr family transcriptional regulator [Rhodovulum sulfidophilum]|uniref:Crp/Fnr family transcriptional regulator n=1 Tax=Rhodovulum sulfidophilum TaxID=35806 RepID=A0A2W5MZ40_RHOSU|nr:MAG: Crp/Fnr family transcriptional regulator [Rhodovulum sulfidophilum]
MSQILIKRAKAEQLLSGEGWLSVQPRTFREEVLRRAVLLRFPPGEVVYRIEDEAGGIFGLVEGTVTVNTAPPDQAPQLIHIGKPGAWTGEGCFLTRSARRIELRTLSETWMMHLSLDQMDQMAAADPAATRYFAQILMASVEVLLRVIHDLQKPGADQRIASALSRSAAQGRTVPLSQSEIGLMSGTSRKQVNAALARFEAKGWVRADYRAVTVLDARGLAREAEGGV